MPHTTSDSNQTGRLEDDVFVSTAKIEGLSHIPGYNIHAEHNLPSTHTPGALEIISVHSGRYFLTKRFLETMPDLRVKCLPGRLEARILIGSKL